MIRVTLSHGVKDIRDEGQEVIEIKDRTGLRKDNLYEYNESAPILIGDKSNTLQQLHSNVYMPWEKGLHEMSLAYG